MKVITFNGSPWRNGNTSILIDRVFEPLRAAGIETEVVQLGGTNIHGCRACYRCFETHNGRCAFDDDVFNGCLDKMRQGDGIILASPTYVTDVTPEIKCLIDRACLVNRSGDGFLRCKVGAAVVAVRRGGEIHAFDAINHLFLIAEMIVPGSCYWNMGIGREKGDVEKDEEGLRTMKVLGENMAWLLKRLEA